MLTNKEWITLDSIYRHRVITTAQLCMLVANPDGTKGSAFASVSRWLKNLKERGLAESKNYNGPNKIWSITTAGVKELRNSCAMYNVSQERYKKQASEIAISEIKINHQLYLNKFAVSLIGLLRNVQGIAYEDEHDSSFRSSFRPDAILTISENTLPSQTGKSKKTVIFLECDMISERKKVIENKIERYREFFLSADRDPNARYAVAFFCCDNQNDFDPLFLDSVVNNAVETNKRDARYKMIKSIADEKLGSLLSYNFDVLVGGTKAVFKSLASFIAGRVAERGELTSAINSPSFGLSFIKRKEMCNYYTTPHHELYVKYDAYDKTFALISYCHESVLHFRLITHHRQMARTFRSAVGADIALLIVASDWEDVARISGSCNLELYQYQDVLITTLPALKDEREIPFGKRMFKVDRGGFSMYDDTMTAFVPMPN